MTKEAMANTGEVKTGEVRMGDLFRSTHDMPPINANIYRAWANPDIGVVVELAYFLPLLQPGEEPPVGQIPAHTKIAMTRPAFEQMIQSFREMLDKTSNEGVGMQGPENP